MRQRIKAVLRAVANDYRTESRWLHTLSYLEFVGARKIGRTVASSHPTVDVLDHLADETRHAAAFKKLAAHVIGAEPTDYLCREAAGLYFHKLDRELAAWTAELVGGEHPILNYLVVTSMIERRAMELYPLYRTSTDDAAVRDELQAIVVEEQDHRVRIERECIALLGEYGVSDLTAPETVEATYFAEFWSVLENELGLIDELDAIA